MMWPSESGPWSAQVSIGYTDWQSLQGLHNSLSQPYLEFARYWTWHLLHEWHILYRWATEPLSIRMSTFLNPYKCPMHILDQQK